MEDLYKSVVQVQLRKCVLLFILLQISRFYGSQTQNELQVDHTDQEMICPERSVLYHDVGIGDLSDVFILRSSS